MTNARPALAPEKRYLALEVHAFSEEANDDVEQRVRDTLGLVVHEVSVTETQLLPRRLTVRALFELSGPIDDHDTDVLLARAAAMFGCDLDGPGHDDCAMVGLATSVGSYTQMRRYLAGD